MSSRIRLSILAFAVLGLGLAGYSSWVHYQLLTDPGYVSPCDINSTFSCSQVYMSRFGSVWGVPVALGGLIWFGLVALIAGFAKPEQKDSVAAAYLFALSTIGLAVILYLGYASFFVLKTGCVLCIGTYVCVTGIFLLTSFTKSESLFRLPARFGADLSQATARPATLTAIVLYVASVISMVVFFPTEGARAEQAATVTASSIPADAQKNFADVWVKQPRVDLGIPLQGAKVIIVKFNDFECPGCRQAEMMYKPVLDRFAKSNPGAVKYVMKDWPWNKDCNFNAPQTIPGHEAACDAAAAARMARDRGKYDAMAEWLFANQNVKPEVVRQATERIVGVAVKDFDKEYALKLPGIRSDIADGGVLKVASTPTYFINGVRLPTDRMVAPEYFELAINLELKKP